MCIDHVAFFQAMIMVSENPYIHGGKVEKNMAEHRYCTLQKTVSFQLASLNLPRLVRQIIIPCNYLSPMYTPIKTI